MGYHNLVILDCGSEDIDHLRIVEKYSDRILVFKYGKYYDSIHSYAENKIFFNEIIKNCKYVTILDADEFLFGLHHGNISRDAVKHILQENNCPILFGTWFNNTTFPAIQKDSICWEKPISFGIDNNLIEIGTKAGKSIIRTSNLTGMRHVGHNLHVAQTVSAASIESFGKIGILHVRSLGEELDRQRILKHLRSRNAVPSELSKLSEIADFLKESLSNGKFVGSEAHYARYFIEPSIRWTQSQRAFSTQLLNKGKKGYLEKNSEFSDSIENYDFESLLLAEKKRFHLN